MSSTIEAVTYSDAPAVTPVSSWTSSANDDAAGPFDALMATTTSGTAVVIVFPGNATRTIYLNQGAIVPLRCRAVLSSSGATGIVGLKATAKTSKP